jgi:hypothetical protein
MTDKSELYEKSTVNNYHRNQKTLDQDNQSLADAKPNSRKWCRTKKRKKNIFKNYHLKEVNSLFGCT